MPFYVPVGPRGLIFRLGLFMYGIVGSVSYWRSARKRVLPSIRLRMDLDLSEV